MPDINPYQPPTKDVAARPSDLGGVARPIAPMPGPVIAVAVILAVYVLWSLLGAIANPGSGVVGAGLALLVLVGVLRRHALAWQWGKIIPVLGAIAAAFALGAVASLSGARGVVFVAILVMLLALQLSIPILMSLRSSRLFFGLQCPHCQSMKVKAANFAFTAFRCRSCGATWHYYTPR